MRSAEACGRAALCVYSRAVTDKKIPAGARAVTSPPPRRHSTLMSGIMPGVESPHLGRRSASLLAEGLFFGGVALAFAGGVGIRESGFFAIFLAAAGLTGRFNKLLEENRTHIHEESESTWRVNAMTAFQILMLFVGVAAAHSVAALWWGEARLQGAFGFALDAARLGQDTLFTRRFSSLGPTLAHNYLVLLTFFALAFVYRAYGALLSLCWNACIWAMVLTLLVARAAHVSSVPPALFVPLATLSVLPHLLIEASSYVVGSLAGIFLSKAVMTYAPSSKAFWRVARAVASLLGIAALGIALGALVEATLPAAVLSRL